MSNKAWKVTLGIFGVFIMISLVGNLIIRGEANGPWVEIKLPKHFTDIANSGLLGVPAKHGWRVQIQEESLASNVNLKVLTMWSERCPQTNVFVSILIFDANGTSKIMYVSTVPVKLNFADPADYRVSRGGIGYAHSMQQIILTREDSLLRGRD